MVRQYLGHQLAAQGDPVPLVPVGPDDVGARILQPLPRVVKALLHAGQGIDVGIDQPVRGKPVGALQHRHRAASVTACVCSQRRVACATAFARSPRSGNASRSARERNSMLSGISPGSAA